MIPPASLDKFIIHLNRVVAFKEDASVVNIATTEAILPQKYQAPT
jgi:hypothetical protein